MNAFMHVCPMNSFSQIILSLPYLFLSAEVCNFLCKGKLKSEACTHQMCNRRSVVGFHNPAKHKKSNHIQSLRKYEFKTTEFHEFISNYSPLENIFSAQRLCKNWHKILRLKG